MLEGALVEKMTFEQKPEGGEGASCWCGDSSRHKNNECKGPEVAGAWHTSGAMQMSLWLE